MTTNQTIDGVSRRMLTALLCHVSELENRALVDELRALLDAERCASCDGSGDLIDFTGEWRGYCVCPIGVALKNKPSAQPQGEPVAWMQPNQGGMCISNEVKQHSIKLGGSPAYAVAGYSIPLYAEQPAPAIKLHVNVSNVKVTLNADGSYSIDPGEQAAPE